MDISKDTINELINKNKDLFKVICSTHYPFTDQELKKYWDNIIMGNAYYTQYISDMEKTFFPEFGLCWNANVVWTDWLKDHWVYDDSNLDKKPKNIDNKMSIGLWDPFQGSYYGGAYKVPLDISKEIGTRYNPFHYDYDMEDFSKKELKALKDSSDAEREILNKKYGALSIETVASFLRPNRNRNLYKYIMITKREIWDYTLSKWIDADIIKELFS